MYAYSHVYSHECIFLQLVVFLQLQGPKCVSNHERAWLDEALCQLSTSAW